MRRAAPQGHNTTRRERGGGVKVTAQQKVLERVAIQDTVWYQSRLRCVQRRIDAYPPDRLYRLKSTGHIVPIHAYIVDQKKCSRCTVKLLKINNPDKVIKDSKMEVAFDDLEMLGGSKE